MQEVKEIFEKLGKADHEMTAYPWWVIIEPKQNMSMDAGTVGMNITGPFFNRESAEEFLTMTRYNFSDRAVVWCASGTDSKDWRKIYNYAKETAKNMANESDRSNGTGRIHIISADDIERRG